MSALLLERDDMERFKARLEDSKRSLLLGATKAKAEGASVDADDLPDELDAAASEHSQSLLLRLRDREKFLLGKIESALERLDDGSFGICDRCGQGIPLSRLEARPVTTLCLDCKVEQEMEEQRAFGRRGALMGSRGLRGMRPVLLLATLLVPLARASAEPVVIKLGTLAPAGSAWHEALKDLALRWEKASGGEVKLRVYPGGLQGNEGDMIRKLGIGQLHAVAISNVGMHDVVPEPQAFSTPLLFRDEAEMECAFGRVRERIESAFLRRDVVVLQWSRIGTASFFCNKPLKTVNDVAHAKTFAWEGDAGAVKAWRTAGFHPVVLSATDLVPALTTGMVDCVSSVPLYMLTSRAFERARYMLDLPLAFLFGATIVRKDAWERIPPEVRGRLVPITREVGEKIDAEIRRLNSDAVDAMKRQGLALLPVDREEWRPVLEKSWGVIRGEVVPAPFFDEVQSALRTCRTDVAAAPGAPRGGRR
jgi:RNA polymerase-binding protein DksA